MLIILIIVSSYNSIKITQAILLKWALEFNGYFSKTLKWSIVDEMQLITIYQEKKIKPQWNIDMWMAIFKRIMIRVAEKTGEETKWSAW